MWVDVLEANGVSVVALDHRHVRLMSGAEHQDYYVVTYDRRVSPSDVADPPEKHALLVASAMSTAAAESAYRRGWSVMTDNGPHRITFRGRTLHLEADGGDAPTSLPSRRGRPGHGLFAVLRTLLSIDGALTQQEVAQFVGVTQPRVSQAMRQLRTLGLVERTKHGWTVNNRAAAIDWWVSHYPGPGGMRSSWFGLDPPVKQAFEVVEFLTHQSARPVVSGDVAADLVAPWRIPQHATLYAERGLDLAGVGLTPAAPGDATLTLILPADRSVWPTGNTPRHFHIDGLGDITRASALQVLFDLTRSAGADAAEAAQTWRNWMLTGPVEP